MLEGLYKLEVSDKDILSYTEIESENDLPEDGDIEEVYYFGGNLQGRRYEDRNDDS